MLGPLPALYRVVVSVIAVLAFVGCGAWVAYSLPTPLLTLAGAGIGAGIGAVVALLLLHEFHRSRPRHRGVRVRSRH